MSRLHTLRSLVLRAQCDRVYFPSHDGVPEYARGVVSVYQQLEASENTYSGLVSPTKVLHGAFAMFLLFLYVAVHR